MVVYGFLKVTKREVEKQVDGQTEVLIKDLVERKKGVDRFNQVIEVRNPNKTMNKQNIHVACQMVNN